MKLSLNEYSLRQDSFARKFFSLLAIVYVLLYIATSQFTPDISFMQKWVIWFGKKILHITDVKKITMTGSGDTTYDYVLNAFVIVLAFIFSLVIAIIDRKRKNYQELYLFTIVIARYYVAFTMLTYGFAKVFEGQFPSLSYYSLEKKFGDMSPMGVLWNFMSTSKAYTFFGGIMEVLGGLLLLFRKTQTIGALISMAVMVNVAILNYTYDVPVKLFSTNIVLICVFILSFEWKKLFEFFILHKPATLGYNKLKLQKKWMLITLRSVKFILIALALYSFFIEPLMAPANEKVPLEGAYFTQNFILNKDTLPENPSDTIRWNKMFIAYKQGINVIRKDNEYSWYTSKIDTVKKTIRLNKYDDTTHTYANFNYSLIKDTLLLAGNIEKDSVKILFTRKMKKDYPLLSRGYHWINEYPYNR